MNRQQARIPKDVDLHVGTRIRERRKTLGMPQQDLAAALGLTFQQVQKYERGANRVSASKLHEIAQKLSVPVAWFFEGLDQADAPTDAPITRALLNATGGLEMARLFAELDPAARMSLLGIARLMHGAGLLKVAAAPLRQAS